MNALRIAAFVLAGALGQTRIAPSHYTPLGACRQTTSGTACWDIAGHDAPDLAAIVGRRGWSLHDPARPIGEERILVMREEPPISNYRAYPPPILDWQYAGSEADGRAIAVLVPVGRRQETASVDLGYVSAFGEEMSLPFRNRASATTAGLRVSIGRPAPILKTLLLTFQERETMARSSLSEGPFVRPIGALMWRFPIAAEGRAGEWPSAAIVPLDRTGTPIEYVDRSGQPLAEARALSLLTAAQKSRLVGDPDLAAPAFRASLGVEAGGSIVPVAWCVTNVAPRAIRQLRIGLFHIVTEAVGPFPLNPAPKAR